MKRIYLAPLLFLFLLPLSSVSAQDDFLHKKDSLLNVIAQSEGHAKLDAYAKLTCKLSFPDEWADSLCAYTESYIQEALKQGDIKQAGKMKTDLICFCLYNYDKREELMEKAPACLAFLKENKLWDYYYETYSTLLETYFAEGKSTQVLHEALELYDFAKKQNHPYGLSITSNLIGLIYQKMDRNKDAEVYYKECIELEKKEKTIRGLLPTAYFGLVEVLSEQKQYAEALAFLKEWESATKKKDEQQGAVSRVGWYNLYMITARVYVEMNEFEQAEPFLDKAEEKLNVERALVNTYYYRAQIWESRKQYAKALAFCEQSYKYCVNAEELPFSFDILKLKARILCKMGQGNEAYFLYEDVFSRRDSLRNTEFNAQLDELRTQYEVDRHISEKERNRNYFLFALAGCILLAIALGIWIYYSRKIARKNRALALQIRAMTEQQELREAELLNKTSFVNEEYLSQIRESNDEFCPESRKDKLCIAIRDLILRDKAYRNPGITRDYVIERLGTNRELFVEAFMYCFGMSFPEYINTLRLKDAVTLLQQSDLTIEEISEKTGFGTVRTFQRQFQTRYGMSAKDYRISAKTS